MEKYHIYLINNFNLKEEEKNQDVKVFLETKITLKSMRYVKKTHKIGY